MNMAECVVDSKQVSYRDRLLDFLVGVVDSAITLCQNFEYSGKFNIIDKKKDDYKFVLGILSKFDSDVIFSFSGCNRPDGLTEEYGMFSVDIFNYSNSEIREYVNTIVSKIENSGVDIKKVYMMVSNGEKICPHDCIRNKFFHDAVIKCKARYVRQNVELFKDESSKYTSEESVLANILIDYFEKVLYILDLWPTNRGGLRAGEGYLASYSDGDVYIEIISMRHCFNSTHFGIKSNGRGIFYLDPIGKYYNDNSYNKNRPLFNEFNRKNHMSIERLFKYIIIFAEALLNIQYTGSYEQYIDDLSNKFGSFINDIVNDKYLF